MADPNEELKQENTETEKVEETTGGAELESDEKDEKKDSPFYEVKLANRVVLTSSRTRSNKLSFYVDRARRILRSDDEVTITGVGNAIAMACTLVEILKRQKIASVKSIETKMNVQPNFYAGDRLQWGRPVTTLVFVLQRGEHAKYVTDFRQRKVIEIFESNDPNHSGQLSKEKIQELNLPEAFYANDQQTKESEDFLDGVKADSLNLPDFIRYASILIHPLLKNPAFKQALASNFGISAGDRGDDN